MFKNSRIIYKHDNRKKIKVYFGLMDLNKYKKNPEKK